MTITSIEKQNKKYKIYVDEVYLFSLYYTEIKKMGLKENEDIGKDALEKIIREIVVKRGIHYVYHLLSKRDYTSQELMRKLVQASYIQEHAENILKPFIEKGLIQDEQYAKKYMEQMIDNKSIRQISYTLQNKGISSENIHQLIEELELDDYEATQKALLKKVKYRSDLSYEEQGKLYQFLSRKGFKSANIRKVIEEFVKNSTTI